MNRDIELTTTSPEQTREVAGIIAAVARVGDVIALTGELGAGKTCFVQGAAAALGVKDRVTSPSFILRKEYEGRLPIMHLDVYRLDSMQEALDIGFTEALDARRVTFVEWGDAMAPLLPPEHLEVELRLPPLTGAPNDSDRHIVLRPHGHDWARRLTGLVPALKAWQSDNGQG